MQEVHAAAQGVIGRHSGMELRQLERFEFYDRAKKAFVVVQAAAERRPYGCFILKKGVVGECRAPMLNAQTASGS